MGQIKKPRVLIVETQQLLGAGLETLLLQYPELELIRVAFCHRLELVKQVEQFQPEIILMDMIAYLTDAALLSFLLKLYFVSRLIVVDADTNLVHIYDKQLVLITHPTDLVKIIQRNIPFNRIAH